MKNILLILCIILTASASHASKIGRITLEELEAKSEYIVLGKVTNIEQEIDRDKVTIEVRKVLKGDKLVNTSISFWLTSRGGLKNFDPELKVDHSVVAFLIEKNGSFKKAYWGSVSIFTKPNYL